MACDRLHSPSIELYFYDELEVAERDHVEAHLVECAECRQTLSELGLMRRALGERQRVEAPPAGDWSGFMRRLDEACRIESAPLDGTSINPAGRGGLPATARGPFATPSWVPRAVAIAAMLLLVATGGLMMARLKPVPPAPLVAGPSGPGAAPGPTADRSSARAVAELSEQHFERSKLVVLGLVARDPEHTSAKDWEYERDLAGSLLEDTRLYRRAAQDQGLSNIAHVMSDLETVLLETSMSDHADAAALGRVQRLIRKRDLVVKMQVVGSTGI